MELVAAHVECFDVSAVHAFACLRALAECMPTAESVAMADVGQAKMARHGDNWTSTAADVQGRSVAQVVPMARQSG